MSLVLAGGGGPLFTHSLGAHVLRDVTLPEASPKGQDPSQNHLLWACQVLLGHPYGGRWAAGLLTCVSGWYTWLGRKHKYRKKGGKEKWKKNLMGSSIPA